MQQPQLVVRVREAREALGWSQEELSRQAGISRTGLSAIERGTLAPATTAALALARALHHPVESLFLLVEPVAQPREWAWPPGAPPLRYWAARFGDAVLRVPLVGPGSPDLPHDGVWADSDTDTDTAAPGEAERTLVLAGCDPAVGMLAAEAARQEQLRLLPFSRSSGAALTLLEQGAVHVAGVHLGGAGEAGNAMRVAGRFGGGFCLLGLTQWQAGIVLRPDLAAGSIDTAIQARLRWVGREPGSGARQCLDQLLGERRAPRRVVTDHRSVAAAVRCGFADAGVALQLVAAEAGLDFLPIQTEAYELCWSRAAEDDWRIQALIRVVRSRRYRQLVAELPGYDATITGQLHRV